MNEIIGTKKSKGKNIFIVILIILILGLVGYIIYDKMNKKDVEQEESPVDPIVIDEVENLDVTSKAVVDLYNSIDVFNGFLGNSDKNLNEYLGYFYKKDLIETKDISNQALLMIAMSNINEENYTKVDNIGRYNIIIPQTEVEKQIKAIFGDINYTNENVIKLPFVGTYTYNTAKETYEITLSGGGFGYPAPELHTKIIKAEKNNDQITINVKYIYEYVDYTDKLIATYYSDLSKQNKIDYAEDNKAQIDELFMKHSDKLSEHQFTFVNENENYIFKSVKKIN